MVSKSDKQKVAKRAAHCCEYCQARADFANFPFIGEHIFPKSLGGNDNLDNLAYSCGFCNGAKYNKTKAIDRISQTEVRLFHPRQDSWSAHFKWDETESIIIGYTAIGRATVDCLKMNMEQAVNLRIVLRAAGLHPPKLTQNSPSSSSPTGLE